MYLIGSGGVNSSESIGFVCGTKGDSVSFFLSKGVSLSFGQIVRIDSGERSFYARVVNAEIAPHLTQLSSCLKQKARKPLDRTQPTEASKLFFS